jgi:hypothetical protein
MTWAHSLDYPLRKSWSQDRSNALQTHVFAAGLGRCADPYDEPLYPILKNLPGAFTNKPSPFPTS